MPALGGMRVLVTRPSGQASGITAAIEGAGGVALHFPTIEILPAADPQALERELAGLADIHVAVFVSGNAVDAVAGALERLGRTWPAGVRTAVVGPASAARLEAAGWPVDIVPASRFDSEGLLAHEALATVRDKKVAIFRGGAGRTLLGDTLRSRGARVRELDCYRRGCPTPEADALARLIDDGVDVVTVTSVAALDNLVALAGGHLEGLRAKPLVGASARVVAAARRHGWAAAGLVAASARDADMLAVLVSLVRRIDRGDGGS